MPVREVVSGRNTIKGKILVSKIRTIQDNNIITAVDKGYRTGPKRHIYYSLVLELFLY